jgi:hypothetical protein
MVMRRRIETRGVDLLGLLAMAVDVSVEQIAARGMRSASNQGTKSGKNRNQGQKKKSRYRSWKVPASKRFTALFTFKHPSVIYRSLGNCAYGGGGRGSYG